MLVWTPILFQDVQFVEVFLYLKYCEQWITVFHLFEVLNKELFAIFAVNLCQITQWNNFYIKSCTRNTCVNFFLNACFGFVFKSISFPFPRIRNNWRELKSSPWIFVNCSSKELSQQNFFMEKICICLLLVLGDVLHCSSCIM